MDSVLVLSGVTPLRYLKDPQITAPHKLSDFSETTTDLAFAYRVDEAKTVELWELAYRLAWLDKGKFYVHGVSKQ